MIADVKNLTIRAKCEPPFDIVMCFTVSGNNREKAFQLQDEVNDRKEFTFEVKKKRVKRSLDANAYAWVLMDKIASVLNCTKEEVYQKAIKDVGVFEIIPVKAAVVKRWQQIWSERGLGWISEVMGDSKIKGYVNVMNYFGSSAYNTTEMSRLIDWLVTEAKEMNIETMSQAEIDSIKKNWG